MEKYANPAPLGLLGFGMTTVLLNIHNAGFFPMSIMVLAMGIFYGGIAQVIAGILEFKKGNTFGMSAFISYGMFWITLVFILIAPKLAISDATPAPHMGWFLLMWGIFTFFMFIATLKINRALQVIFGTLTILYILLAIRDWTGNETIGVIAGYEGLICGFSAIYLAAAEILNEKFNKIVLPI